MSSASAFFDNIVFVFNDLYTILKGSGLLQLAKGLKTLAGMWK
ncbi:hypothetical protein FRC0263_02121 [Corynebacterium diphtheriae]|nr:hypothetical protein FRC0135_01854 [Corynebacterium diphtheriae]CAB0816581.1 hypothetical protein FRC0263_02121 [Corynebacterium diphtheriae]